MPKISKELYETLATLIKNVEPLINKVAVTDTDTKRNVVNSLQKIKELKEILEIQSDEKSSKRKFKQLRIFNFWI